MIRQQYASSMPVVLESGILVDHRGTHQTFTVLSLVMYPSQALIHGNNTQLGVLKSGLMGLSEKNLK